MKKSNDTKANAPTKSRREIKKFWTDEGEQELSETSRKKRAQIIEAALETFLQLGYEGASMNLVAERAGVIKQTIYSHFQDKQSLFREVIASLTVDYVQNALQEPELINKPLPAVLRKIAETILARHQDPRHIRFVRTMIGEAERFPELAKLFTDTTVRPVLSLIVERIKNQTIYKFDDPEAFARVFIGTVVNHCLQQHILHGKELLPFDATRLVDELVAIVELHRVS
ncbi:MAG: TetR/AcrR family transcriptional regulator [Cyanobacteria bacterium SZAS-4]|nr:TetR/AcrR family transcriptional regulator [Cyanobacteria bacterium SZAS-4]